MPSKFKGVNSKVEAANAKKNAAKALKDQAASRQHEAEVAKDWKKGADIRGDKKQEEDELRKQLEDKKKQEKKALLEAEEAELGNMKKIKGVTKRNKAQKAMDKPWELAIAPATSKSGLSRRALEKKKAEQAREQANMEAKAKAEKMDAFDGLAPNIDLTENKNHKHGIEEARNIDDAIGLLSVGGKEAERHPERRAKAAYKAFEETMLPQMRADHPGLKLSQYKQKIFDSWKKSPENPLNQESTAYNQKRK